MSRPRRIRLPLLPRETEQLARLAALVAYYWSKR